MDPDKRTRVAEVMSTPLETVEPNASVQDAARKMREKNISALVVTAGSRSIITQTDIIDAVANGEDVATTAVSDVMTENVETVTPDLLMEEVAAMMTMYGVKHLPVVEDDYVGMVSSTDVTAHLS
ncbi:CBS domain-containing protein [Halorubrum vacuolatum]|uniref:CBS domain-containing protein n=1 Tax=Halorubrum vacuolatum TaxID=63740 RepID=A0A238UM92_HALVU|nr:CBS domain-containing protein [Halorubrum vacuolatum]SNR23071.1 CBS domain-containing protein [Halorubrum vacuolatum]